MRHVVVNALNLRPGGGLQVVGGLLSRFSDENKYTVLWSDSQAFEFLRKTVDNNRNTSFAKPVRASGNLSVFMWQMTRMSGWLARSGADVVLNVNHHFPVNRIPQVVYHLNVLRFDRQKNSIFSLSEWADSFRDARARRALAAAESNVFESRYLLGLAQAHIQNIRNPSVQYIGLDDTRSTMPRIVGDPEPQILAITSPQPHKNNDLLLDILVSLNRKSPGVPWKLFIAGGRSPDAFSRLRKRAETMRVAHQIDWLGFRSHDELARIGNASLCLVSTSRIESFCMVALEAMSWACPAIVADATSMPESVGSAGLLAEPGNAIDFADKIISLRQEPQFRLALINRGLEHAAHNTWSAAARHFEKVFSELAKDSQFAP